MDEVVVVGMEEVDWRICPRNKSGRGYGEGEMENMPKKQEWSWVWRRKIQKYTQKARVVVGMEKENSEICPRNKSGRGYGEGKIRNIPRKQEWSWVWRRKIQKYTQKARVVVGMEEVDWRICPRNRSVVGMEKENSEIYPRNRSVVGMEEVKWRICPRNKSGRGYGEGKFRNIPKKQKCRGHGGGKFRNMPKKQEWSWAWRRKIQKYAQEAEAVVGMEG